MLKLLLEKVNWILCNILLNFLSLPSDVNECENDPGLCDHVCRNTIGSYTCSCVPGYVLAGDGVACNPQGTHESLHLLL